VAGAVSRETLRVTTASFPATSRARTTTALGPSASGTEQSKRWPETLAGAPPQVTPSSPERPSPTAPATAIDAPPACAPSTGEVTLKAGGVLSMLSVTPAVAVLPARSVAVPSTTWFAPSVVTSAGGGQDATPLARSAQVNVTVTPVLFQPAALGCGAAFAPTAGGSWSKP
jgi:hypothetical protein